MLDSQCKSGIVLSFFENNHLIGRKQAHRRSRRGFPGAFAAVWLAADSRRIKGSRHHRRAASHSARDGGAGVAGNPAEIICPADHPITTSARLQPEFTADNQIAAPFSAPRGGLGYYLSAACFRAMGVFGDLYGFVFETDSGVGGGGLDERRIDIGSGADDV